MAKIDVNQYMEQCGVRKARFGGYEPEDVRQALRALCSDYEQSLAVANAEARAARQESDALRRRCQTLLGQNQNLAAQNATLAGQADKISQRRDDLETRYSKVQERNHSLSDQVAVLRLKNGDLTRENKELTDRAEEAEAALRIKGRAHDEARQQVLKEKEQVLADARTEADKIRQKAHEDADALLAETNRKAEAIDQLAREQAISQARKMVQAATDETREIQNAHRLRLQDLKSRIAAMEQQRDKLMDFFSQMIGELQEAQDYARQNTPIAPYDEEVTEASPEPRLDLSDKTVDAAAAALPAAETPSSEDGQEPVNCVVAPGLDEEEPAPPRTVELVPEEETTPSPEYFDTEPKQQPSDPPEIEIPGAIFSYPILRQEGEPILDEEPPAHGPHTPVMPDLSDTGEGEDLDSGDIQILPERKPEENPRRKKAVAALRALRKKMSHT
ncbi:hypothetical protein [Subdoligranulum variabile]|uniref:DivIVA domain protein n=1 Tax=Subdoligranulum variabile DSM 15176 TaxID=411471 RepID=D1PPK2_9FIRM|nr:hypothetical protein [Subdoligranulum variabile]EFB75346.1 hypothetical protein SUBVAR_06317 [Subdoligranulum variabile DSM 15176]UWP69127.1 hypothetical protein NQ490_04540 [Subdoligranulum variabile]